MQFYRIGKSTAFLHCKNMGEVNIFSTLVIKTVENFDT